MIRFDSIDKKPTVWNVAVLSAITAVLLIFQFLKGTAEPVFVFAVLCIYFILTILFLIVALIRQLKYNPYSYNTIYYIGFSLFLLVLLFSTVTLYADLRSAGLSGMIASLNLIASIVSSAKTYMLLSSPLILLFSIILCVSNISLIRHEGRSIYNTLGFVLSFLSVGGILFLYFSDRYFMGSEWEAMVHDIFINIYAAIYLYFECMMIGTTAASLIVTRYRPDPDRDFILILGCALMKDGTPTPLLKARADRALEFAAEQEKESGKKAIFIPSGGKGEDEVISEAQSIRNYLLERGVDESRIILEDRSTSTYENMLFSKQIIDSIDPKAKVLFSTNGFHVFRSGLMAHRVKMRAVGIGSKTKWYFWPNALVREFVGLLTRHKLKQALILIGLVVAYVVMTMLIYSF